MQAKNEIEILVNALYKEWLLTNDEFVEDFKDFLYDLLPDHSFTLCNGEWKLLSILNKEEK